MVILENIIIKNKIKKFIKEVEHYNSQHNLKSFEEFIFHNYNGICSSTFGILTTAPKLLLVGSKSFKKYYSNLDIDFKRDFFDSNEEMYTYNYFYKILKENKTIQKYIENYLKEDFMLKRKSNNVFKNQR